MIHTIAFICTANMCRSPIAHAICVAEARRRGLVLRVLSAGIDDFEGMSVVRDARLVCERRGTPMLTLVATHVAHLDLAAATRIFVMERSQLAAVQSLGVDAGRITLLGDFDPKQRGAEIDDPIGKEAAAFEECYDRLRDCIVQYLDSGEVLIQAVPRPS